MKLTVFGVRFCVCLAGCMLVLFCGRPFNTQKVVSILSRTQ